MEKINAQTYNNISKLFIKDNFYIDTICSNEQNSDKWKIHNERCCVMLDKNDVCAVVFEENSNSNRKVFKNVKDASYHIDIS